MSVETQKPQEKQADKELIDLVWFDELSEISQLGDETYKLLRLDADTLAEKRAEFEARLHPKSLEEYEQAKDFNPILSANLSVEEAEELAEKEERLLALKDRIKTEETNEDIRKAYIWRINEMLALNRMVIASVEGDERAYHWYNLFAYGRPDKQVFLASVAYYRQMATDLMKGSTDKRLRKLAKDVLNSLPAIDDEDLPDVLPDEETFNFVQDLQVPYYGELLNGVSVPEDGFENWSAADPQTRQVMDNVGAQDYELVDTEKGAKTWSVSHSRKKVFRPLTNIAIKAVRYIGLPVGHEIGTHVAEYIKGMKTGFGLSALGLDRYIGASEAKGTIREQVAFDDVQGLAQMVRFQDIIRRHMAVSLAYGHGGEEMDFRGVYEVINKIDRLWNYSNSSGNYKEAIKEADTRTWNLLSTRTQKGTTGKGGAYYKDKIYLEANIAYWKLAKDHPEIIEQWDLGKFDLTNPRHIMILQRLGVLPVPEDDEL